MTKELSRFIRALSLEPNLLEAFYADPEGILANSELGADDQQRILQVSTAGRARWAAYSNDMTSVAGPGRVFDDLLSVAGPGRVSDALLSVAPPAGRVSEDVFSIAAPAAGRAADDVFAAAPSGVGVAI